MQACEKPPCLTRREWRSIEPLLPRNPAGRQRIDDELFVTSMLLMRATRCSAEEVAVVLGINANSLRTRFKRWKASGLLDRIEQAAQPALLRLRQTWRKGWLTNRVERRVRSGAVAP